MRIDDSSKLAYNNISDAKRKMPIKNVTILIYIREQYTKNQHRSVLELHIVTNKKKKKERNTALHIAKYINIEE